MFPSLVSRSIIMVTLYNYDNSLSSGECGPNDLFSLSLPVARLVAGEARSVSHPRSWGLLLAWSLTATSSSQLVLRGMWRAVIGCFYRPLLTAYEHRPLVDCVRFTKRFIASAWAIGIFDQALTIQPEPITQNRGRPKAIRAPLFHPHPPSLASRSSFLRLMYSLCCSRLHVKQFRLCG